MIIWYRYNWGPVVAHRTHIQ